MEWLLDLTAEELETRSKQELEELLSPEVEATCMEHMNKLVLLAVEQGRTFIYLTGFSPSKSFLPLFGEHMARATPLMTEKLKAHLQSKGLSVEVYHPFFASVEMVQKAGDNGDHYGAVTVSWDKKDKTA